MLRGALTALAALALATALYVAGLQEVWSGPASPTQQLEGKCRPRGADLEAHEYPEQDEVISLAERRYQIARQRARADEEFKQHTEQHVHDTIYEIFRNKYLDQIRILAREWKRLFDAERDAIARCSPILFSVDIKAHLSGEKMGCIVTEDRAVYIYRSVKYPAFERIGHLEP